MPRKQQPRKTWRYSDEFKVNAVALSYQEGVQVREVAHSLDVHPFMLSRWRKQYRDGTIKADRRKKKALAMSMIFGWIGQGRKHLINNGRVI